MHAATTCDNVIPVVVVARASDIPEYHRHMASFYRNMIQREYYIQLD